MSIDDAAIGDAGDDGFAWPAFVDLLAASTLVVVILLAVFVFEKVRADAAERDRRMALLTALREAQQRNGNFTVEDDGQLVRIVLRDDVTFPSMKYQLSEMQKKGVDALKSIGGVLTSPSVRKNYRQVSVVGHTDRISTGDENWTNWELSASRAASVARQLVVAGMDPCRVSASGAGRYYPVIKNARTAPQLKENRRIEIEILPARELEASAINDRCERDLGNSVASVGGLP